MRTVFKNKLQSYFGIAFWGYPPDCSLFSSEAFPLTRSGIFLFQQLHMKVDFYNLADRVVQRKTHGCGNQCGDTGHGYLSSYKSVS